MGDLDVSNAIRLTGRQWIGLTVFMVALYLLTPVVWQRAEKLDVGPDYRIPFALSNDYWLWSRVAAQTTATHDTVIESVSSGVREIPLENFVARNHLLIVVRPSHMSAADGRAALARARTKLGVEFDFSGMFGFDDPDRFYCTELVYWASQTAARTGSHERIVTPPDLMKYGEVIYWSGKRDDAQVGEIAIERRRTAPRTAAAQ